MAFDLQREFTDFLETIRRMFNPTAEKPTAATPRGARSSRTETKSGAAARKRKAPGGKPARPKPAKTATKRGSPRKRRPEKKGPAPPSRLGAESRHLVTTS